MATKVKADASRADIAATVWQVLQECESDPADKIIALGNALTKIGEALKDRPIDECRRVIRSAAALHGIEL